MLQDDAHRLRVPLHLGKVEQPQNSPRGPVRLIIGASHFGQRGAFGSIAAGVLLVAVRAVDRRDPLELPARAFAR